MQDPSTPCNPSKPDVHPHHHGDEEALRRQNITRNKKIRALIRYEISADMIHPFNLGEFEEHPEIDLGIFKPHLESSDPNFQFYAIPINSKVHIPQGSNIFRGVNLEHAKQVLDASKGRILLAIMYNPEGTARNDQSDLIQKIWTTSFVGMENVMVYAATAMDTDPYPASDQVPWPLLYYIVNDDPSNEPFSHSFLRNVVDQTLITSPAASLLVFEPEDGPSLIHSHFYGSISAWRFRDTPQELEKALAIVKTTMKEDKTLNDRLKSTPYYFEPATIQVLIDSLRLLPLQSVSVKPDVRETIYRIYGPRIFDSDAILDQWTEDSKHLKFWHLFAGTGEMRRRVVPNEMVRGRIYKGSSGRSTVNPFVCRYCTGKDHSTPLCPIPLTPGYSTITNKDQGNGSPPGDSDDAKAPEPQGTKKPSNSQGAAKGPNNNGAKGNNSKGAPNGAQKKGKK